MVSRRIAVVSAGLSQPSSTRLLADRLAEESVAQLAERGIASEVSTIELRDVAHDITNHTLTGFAPPKLQAGLESVVGADGVIMTTPIFTTSYSGLFKSFIDVIDADALVDMPVLLGATGGSARHSLAIEYAMRPLFTYLRSRPVTTGVFAASADWGDSVKPLSTRIQRAASEFADLVSASDRSQRSRDPLALDLSFEQMMERFSGK